MISGDGTTTKKRYRFEVIRKTDFPFPITEVWKFFTDHRLEPEIWIHSADDATNGDVIKNLGAQITVLRMYISRLEEEARVYQTTIENLKKESEG